MSTSSIKYSPVSTGMPPLPLGAPIISTPGVLATPVLSELIEAARPLIQSEIKTAVDKSYSYADALNSARLAEISAEIQKLTDRLASAAHPTTVIAGISVNDAVSQPISPELTTYRTEIIAEILALNKQGINNFMLVGPAGCGKTTLASQLAQALKMPHGHMPCSEGMSETWLLGRQMSTGYVESSFCTCYENGSVFLKDELDAAGGNVLIVANMALENGEFYNPIAGRVYKRHANTIILAGCNTFGRGGDTQYMRNRLDKATLDRYYLIVMDYDNELERKFCPDKVLLAKLWEARIKLRELSSEESITTRNIRDAYRAQCAGMPARKVYAALTLPWVAGLAEQVGLVEEAPNSSATTEDAPF